MNENNNLHLRKLTNNILWGFFAQGTALLASVVMSFVVAKIISVTQYSYWQLYIFYLSYVCFFHLGLPDGIYLRMGGDQYENLNKEILGSELKIMIIFHSVISVIICILTLIYVNDIYRIYVLIFSACYLILMNIFNYLGMILQAVNRTQEYSKGVIIDRLCFLFFIFVLCYVKVKTFIPFAILYLVSRAISILFIANKTKDILITRLRIDSQVLQELRTNIKIGINLTVSVISSMLIIGVGRNLIDINYGIETFGKLALTLSLTNFFLNFLSQISMVLFPALRTISTDDLKKLYNFLNTTISFILIGSLLFFYPLVWILSLWLPEYSSSLIFLSILMPICVFDGKNQIIGNTYLKVLRCEKQLLRINVIAMIISALLCSISVYVFENITYVLYSIVLSIFIKYFLSTVVVQKNIEVKDYKPIVFEIIISLIFIISNKVFEHNLASLVFFTSFGIYLVLQKKVILGFISIIKKKMRGYMKL